MCTLDDQPLREMIRILKSIQEIIESLVYLKEVPEAALMLQDILDEAQTAIDTVASLRWLKLDAENAERDLIIVRDFTALLERTMASPIH